MYHTSKVYVILLYAIREREWGGLVGDGMYSEVPRILLSNTECQSLLLYVCIHDPAVSYYMKRETFSVVSRS